MDPRRLDPLPSTFAGFQGTAYASILHWKC
jgi:hypothetical protein